MVFTQAGGAISASTQLGMDFQMNQYLRRTEALTDPKTYAAKREIAFKTMMGGVNTKFAETLNTYLGTGMPPEMAKQFALQAADNERRIREQVFEVDFPSGANVLEQGRSIAIANTKNFPGGMPARRAPARRRPSARRRR